MTDKVTLGKLSTGVAGLDILLGGGLSEFSFNLIAGAPGSGKTTLAHQIMFALTNSGRKALFFTVLGEPPIKMLRYQQQYSFFDVNKVGDTVRYINLAEDLRKGDFSGVLDRISKEAEDFSPGLVFVDSFRSVMQTAKAGNEGVADLQHFVQELGIRMASWQATTFLIGEYAHLESEANPIMTVADGLISLSQNVDKNSVTRKLRIVKMRGQAHMSGFHTFRIGNEGIHVYPRLLPPLASDRQPGVVVDTDPRRISLGLPQLDDLLCGGLPYGHSVLVVGPTGAGKTIIGTSFLAEGSALGEKGVLAVFEKGASPLRNPVLAKLIQSGDVTVVESRSLDLSIEELVDNLVTAVQRTGARRVVIDSLSDLELYLAPAFQQDLRASVFKMLTALAETGATVVVTVGLEDRFTDMRFSQSDISFLVDAVIALRYTETKGRLQKLLTVVKVRGSGHSTDLRPYVITETGIKIGEKIEEYEGLLSGHPSTIQTPE